MTLTSCSDLSAAGWIAESDLPWPQLVCFGPAGFEAYARLRFLPDPDYPGQSENDAYRDQHTIDQLPTLFELLAAHTSTPSDCYFCVWDGFGTTEGGDGAIILRDEHGAAARIDRPGFHPGLEPRSGPSAFEASKVVVPNRAFFLFRGPLEEIGNWDTAAMWPGHPRLDQADPAFVWPSDHAWCVSHDVDPHWAGVGAGTSVIERLAADPRLDLVPANPAEEQPFYH